MSVNNKDIQNQQIKNGQENINENQNNNENNNNNCNKNIEDNIKYIDITFPNYPPQDENLNYDPNLAEFKINPLSKDQIVKFCGICDQPINICIVIFPCNDYMCYECFKKNQQICLICNQLVKKHQILECNQEFYSCELQDCRKFFNSEIEYVGHQMQHQEILDQNQKILNKEKAM